MPESNERPDDDQKRHKPCCAECGGEVECDDDGEWTCVADRGHWLGCGWSGPEPSCLCEWWKHTKAALARAAELERTV